MTPEQLDEIERLADQYRSVPATLPIRPKRNHPTHWQVAQYWFGDTYNALYYPGRDYVETLFALLPAIDLPHCFRCGCYRQGTNIAYSAKASNEYAWNHSLVFLERAHLVDRQHNGLDHPPNIVLLCHSCHAAMPSFAAEQGLAAIAWVRAGQPEWDPQDDDS